MTALEGIITLLILLIIIFTGIYVTLVKLKVIVDCPLCKDTGYDEDDEYGECSCLTRCGDMSVKWIQCIRCGKHEMTQLPFGWGCLYCGHIAKTNSAERNGGEV